MTIPQNKVYPRDFDHQTVYLKNVVKNPMISVGDYTMYNDFVNDPTEFEKNNVIYHYPINGDRVTIGKFCSIACGAKFLMASGHHAMQSLSTYPFPLFFDEWELDRGKVAEAWDHRGDVTVGNDVWIGCEAIIMAGVTVGDGAIIGTRAVVTHDVPPYAVVGGVPAKIIRYRYPADVIEKLEALHWWDWPKARIARSLDAIRAGDLDRLLQG